jgi:hypothetical protein
MMLPEKGISLRWQEGYFSKWHPPLIFSRCSIRTHFVTLNVKRAYIEGSRFNTINFYWMIRSICSWSWLGFLCAHVWWWRTQLLCASVLTHAKALAVLITITLYHWCRYQHGKGEILLVAWKLFHFLDPMKGPQWPSGIRGLHFEDHGPNYLPASTITLSFPLHLLCIELTWNRS